MNPVEPILYCPIYRRAINCVVSAITLLLFNISSAQTNTKDSIVFPVLVTDLPSDIFKPGKPLLTKQQGWIDYTGMYRSNIDTPFIEKGLLQNVITGQIQFTAARVLPLTASWFIRTTNANNYRNIYDVRIDFNAPVFNRMLKDQLHTRLQRWLQQVEDSLKKKLPVVEMDSLNKVKYWLNNPFNTQKLIEYNEILKIPAISYDSQLPDSLAKKKTDSLKKVATAFIKLYNKHKEVSSQLKTTSDSLVLAYKKMRSNIERMRRMLETGEISDWVSLEKFQKMTGIEMPDKDFIPRNYKWLAGIKNISLGKTVLNYNELAARNINLNGINFEYNSWYYFALSAGWIDNRFRDFVTQPAKSFSQYFYMLRLGIGRLENNYIILSAYKGKKQLYGYSATGSRGVPVAVSGLSIESQWRVHRNITVQAEVAQSFAPDNKISNQENDKSWSLNNPRNKAYSLKATSMIPRKNFRLEALYKYSGANFQSFSSYQNGSANTAWYVKADKAFFNRMLRVTAAIRKNEFSNPYVLQTYSSNAIFKSVQLSFRRRHWPTVSIGYMPTAQVSKMDNYLIENRFYALNASALHQYKLAEINAQSSVLYNKFYNNAADTSYLYFNAANVYVSQTFLFRYFTTTVSVSHSSNNHYKLNVLEGQWKMPLLRRGSVDVGCRINTFNNIETRTGATIGLHLPVFKYDMVHASFDQSFFPGQGNRLSRNDLFTIGYSKTF